MYYAHTTQSKDKSDWQLLRTHLAETAKLTQSFAEKFAQNEFGYLLGIFHDIGKYSEKFQKKLDGYNIQVDHSTAGAQEIIQCLRIIGKIILSYCIAGHHSGLMNTRSLEERLQKKLDDYLVYTTDLASQNLTFDIKNLDQQQLSNKLKPFLQGNNKDVAGFSLSFLVRILYSCLVDADWLNSEEFCEKAENIFDENANYRNGFENLITLREKLSQHLSQFGNSANMINQARQQIQKNCLQKSQLSKGLYTLTVPTGGGKTLSSLVFALNHATKNNQDRIIYTIPYTSIIEQNAEIFKKIFGDENVLEHHSNYVFEGNNDFDDENEQNSKRLKYASENWSAPIIATTNVQFFESLFSHKKSKCRKLHNIANSVIVMDEAQMIPVDYLNPCLQAIEELILHYNCTIVIDLLHGNLKFAKNVVLFF